VIKRIKRSSDILKPVKSYKKCNLPFSTVHAAHWDMPMLKIVFFKLRRFDVIFFFLALYAKKVATVNQPFICGFSMVFGMLVDFNFQYAQSPLLSFTIFL
jgi:hypothetical protein